MEKDQVLAIGRKKELSIQMKNSGGKNTTRSSNLWKKNKMCVYETRSFPHKRGKEIAEKAKKNQ